MAHAWDLYAKGLMPLGYGYPLWGPEPDPTYGEVRLGDVGYIQDGHFCFLFNAMRDAGDPINKDGVPDPFEAFTPPVSTTIHRPDEITQSQLHSRSLQSISVSTTASASELGAAATAGLRFQCSEETGALLMLKQPAHKTYLNCAVHIRQYIRNHLSSWCDFANQIRGIGLQEKDIIFISGHTKTSVWAEAAFHHSNSNGELVIGGSCFVPSVSGEFRVSMSRCTDATVFSRYGPRELVSSWSDDPTALPCMPKCQQSIFVNYYKMKTRRWPLRHTVIRAAAGPHELPDDDEDDDPSTGTPESWRPVVSSDDEIEAFDEQMYDPVEHLLDHILEHSNAQVACAADDDLACLFKGQAFPEDLESALETLAPRVIVDEHGVGMIAHELDSGADRTSPSSSLVSPSSHPPTTTSPPSAVPLGSRCVIDVARRRRQSEHEPKSSRHVLTIAALELARDAVRLDSTDTDPYSTMRTYSKYVSYSDQVLQGTGQQNDGIGTSRYQDASIGSEAQRLRSVHDTYAARMNDLGVISTIPLPFSESILAAEDSNFPVGPSISSVGVGTPRRGPLDLAVVESLPVDRQLARQLAYICDASHSGSLLECNPDLVPPPSSLLGEDMDDAQSDDEDSVLWSLAQQKLAALTDPNRHSTLGLLTQQQQVNGKDQDQDPTIATNPLTHPYNLPAPALPIMPRTIRRQMLQTSAGDSWSLQRNSMWEGQVSRTNLAAQRAGGGLCNSAWMEFASALNQNWSRRDISDLSPSHIWPSDHDVSSTAALTMDHTLDPLFPTSSFLGEDQLGSTSPDGFLLSANNIHEPLPQVRRASGSTGKPEHGTRALRVLSSSSLDSALLGSLYLNHSSEAISQPSGSSLAALSRATLARSTLQPVEDETLLSSIAHTPFYVRDDDHAWQESELLRSYNKRQRGDDAAAQHTVRGAPSRVLPRRRTTGTARDDISLVADWTWIDTPTVRSPSGITPSPYTRLSSSAASHIASENHPGNIAALQLGTSDDTGHSVKSSTTWHSYNSVSESVITASAITESLRNRQPDEEGQARHHRTQGKLGNGISAIEHLTIGSSSSSSHLSKTYSQPALLLEDDVRGSICLSASASRRLTTSAPLHQATSQNQHSWGETGAGTDNVATDCDPAPTNGRLMDDLDHQAQTSSRTSSPQRELSPRTTDPVLTGDRAVTPGTSLHLPSSTQDTPTGSTSRRLTDTVPASVRSMQARQTASDTLSEKSQQSGLVGTDES